MKKRPNPRFESYLEKTSGNQIDVLSSEKCGCVFCRAVFDAREVCDWTSAPEGLTALCPSCGMPAILPGNLGIEFDHDFMRAINLYTFGTDYMVEHPEALHLYCSRYLQGEITHKKANEELFVKYLTKLYERDDPIAASMLGHYYLTGGEFHRPDRRKAIEVYSHPSLADDEASLCALGGIYVNGYGGKEGAKKGFEILTKALALGSEEAIYFVAKCYLDGIAVEKDPVFAYTSLYREFEILFHRFRHTGKDANLFIEFAFQLGNCCDKGLGIREDRVRALRYYLLADFGLRTTDMVMHDERFENELRKRIEAIAKTFDFKPGKAVFDQDTFFDSFAEQQEVHTKKTILTPVYYEEEKTLRFDVKFDEREILVDIGNLACQFIQGITSWEFREIASISEGKKPLFFRYINFSGEEGWLLCGDDETALTIRFAQPEEEPEENQPSNP